MCQGAPDYGEQLLSPKWFGESGIGAQMFGSLE
jgi:hypothetical protein